VFLANRAEEGRAFRFIYQSPVRLKPQNGGDRTLRRYEHQVHFKAL
jgi:hypothetical protein